jgi:hypothetical protein
MNVDFELILESDQPKEEIYELQEWLEESNLKNLEIKLKAVQENDQGGQMGLETLAVLELIATFAGSAGVVAFINGLFSCIKSYILTKSKEKQVILKKGDAEIVFNSESVKDLQSLIEKSIGILGTFAEPKTLGGDQKADSKRLLSSDL